MSNLSNSLTNLSTLLETGLSTTIYFDQVLEKNDLTPWPIVEINLLESIKEHFGAPTLTTHLIQLIYSFESQFDRLSIDSVSERIDKQMALRNIIQAWYQTDIGNILGPLSNITSKHDVYENGEYGSFNVKISRVFTQFQIQIKDN